MKNSLLLLLLLCVFACAEEPSEVLSIKVKNNLSIDRAFETVEIDISEIEANNNTFEVINTKTNTTLISQTVDSDANGKDDTLLFQPKLSGNAETIFSIRLKPSEEKNDSTLLRCYSRFVPERTDDYAWENNRVAFRTYGPVAQKMKEDGVKGGTLSSGMDAWLKRVDYPIINKWYKKHTSGAGSYHEDTGEGLDNFHVGVSRGVGGIAVKTDTTYSVSKNFTSYKTITNGPIRTSFVLEYAPWDANGKKIKETKHISLDYGQNLSKHEINILGSNTLSTGLTLHNKDGNTETNLEEGWMSYWEPYFDSELGQGIVTLTKNIVDFNEYTTSRKDESNLYVQLKANENKVIYYAGFGWKKSGQFENEQEWNSYLSNFSKCINNPLEVTTL